ncbi:MAG TPA: 2-C-methyl-D-erythritol 4-phosphate cytidylyltransferase [Longimicrobiales bacterium]|nr:2-C-methyl-D-erythritol 4-phosphate cytidylyltransferase [Longimicrobiales bacterium]
MSRVAVIIAAGGSGRRMGGVYKPLLELRGAPLLARSLAPFLARPDVHAIIVALPQDLHAAPPAWLLADPRVRTVAGGAERDQSVRNALQAVPPDANVILVHDAARPLVSAEVVERCVAAARAGRSVVAAVPVTDTIKRIAADGTILDTPDRSLLRAAQTPQAFPAAVLRAAHAHAAATGIRATDDAALAAAAGHAVAVVDGAVENIKVTSRMDLAVAEILLAGGDT